jgi:hypothetical protein
MPKRARPSKKVNMANPAPDLSRRGFIVTASIVTVGGFVSAERSARAAIVRTDIASLPPFGNSTLPPGVRSRVVNNINGLAMPGAFERMQNSVCTQWRGTFIVEGAGHWVQQEQPDEVSKLLLQFLRGQP